MELERSSCSQLRGRAASPAGEIDQRWGAQRRLLAPTFPAGDLLLFIP